MKAEVVRLLQSRGVTLEAIAQVVLAVQGHYFVNLTLEECLLAVEAVVEKREVQHAVLTGAALDMLAEQRRLPEPLGAILRADDGLYGVDEVMALAVTNIYGSIGLTNFGYLDKEKLGIIGELNRRKGGQVHTFLDDLVAAIAAAAAARIAHQRAGGG
ncbi:MAG: phosphatidylglycerophosphatase A [Acetobacteraceae bacterium]|nr:phosphatidylglycerophosphatase A [Acetobacteraceae bacterium]